MAEARNSRDRGPGAAAFSRLPIGRRAGGDVGAALGVALLVSSLLTINAVQAVSLAVRPFSDSAFRGLNRSLARAWWGWLVEWTEHAQGVEIVISGDDVPPGENAIILANHQQMPDILVVMALAARKGRLADLKWFLKDSLKYVPGVGWGLLFLDSLFVKRDWNRDQDTIRRTFSLFHRKKVAFWLIMFAEGTRITARKLERSQDFARRQGLPVLRHVLIPRPKGFLAAIEGLGSQLDAVYDLTIGYPERAPGLLEFLMGHSPRAYLNVRRFARSELPSGSQELASWLRGRFEEKDRLMEKFVRLGRF